MLRDMKEKSLKKSIKVSRRGIRQKRVFSKWCDYLRSITVRSLLKMKWDGSGISESGKLNEWPEEKFYSVKKFSKCKSHGDAAPENFPSRWCNISSSINFSYLGKQNRHSKPASDIKFVYLCVFKSKRN